MLAHECLRVRGIPAAVLMLATMSKMSKTREIVLIVVFHVYSNEVWTNVCGGVVQRGLL